MPYIIILIIIFLIIGIYIISREKENEEENPMENIPTININKEGLEKHATEISHHFSDIKKSNCKRTLMKSLQKSYGTILKGYEYIDKEVANKKEVTPAAEWLLDNVYLIEKEVKDIKTNMPDAYYRNLPVINKGSMKGYPRVYYIAVEMISHTDGRIDEMIIEDFIKAYQKNAVLTSGELWAMPIMIRIALIQNISKIVSRLILTQEEKKKADSIGEILIDSVNNNKLESEIKRLNADYTPFTSHFIERLLKVLRDNGIDNSSIYEFIDKKLELQETTVEKMVTAEHQKQASFQLSIGNCINGLRAIEALNWREIFEKLSYVDQILREDPSGIYESMEFESKDYYRHEIEKLAKYMGMAESFVAKKAIECARESSEGGEVVKHVGYYIMDEGISCLKEKINFQDRGVARIRSSIKKGGVNWYIGTIACGTILISLFVLFLSYYYDKDVVYWKYIVAIFAVIIPASEVMISILNWSTNRLTTPSFIPKIEFRDGIPEEYSAIVVIPTLLNSENRVHDLVNDMEVYYLANQEKNIYFALLGDFKDSSNEHEELDQKIIEAALCDIRALNEKYCKDGEEIFYFFNRYRQFNEKEGIWLGYERKRGKLMEFNSLLRGNKNTSYNVISGDVENLYKVKYVITLDADTQLPRDCAKKLIGAMAHVLNQCVIDKKYKRVLRGYGLMQPRVSVGTISANKTLYSKIFSGETGIDMYTTAVSDVYQDLFGEGIFTGKGIYDIDAFEGMLKDEIPENAVLSHDLLEGSYVKTALVTDIQLIDGYPAYYNSSSMRLHRWVRGDWQLLPWLFKKSPINRLSKWKIFDNLRRSLLTPAIMLLIILSLTVLPDGSDKWLILAFLALLSPIFFDVSEAVVSPIKGISLSGTIENRKVVVEQVFLIFCFLPYNAYLMVDAIIRTLYRLFISKRNLLEWQTAADVEQKLGKKLKNFIMAMYPASLLAVLIFILSISKSANMAVFFLPSCTLWFVSPYIAYYISQEQKQGKARVKEDQIELLRRLSRRTWAYFEDFVNAENNWLAPDNFQEDPPNGVAYRTSPTNIGMALTSNIVAYDLGYLGMLDMIERMDKTLTNMERLNRYKGHFYNWYDTKTIEPLHPRYISTVDSGNLVGYLWVASEALLEYKNKPALNSIQSLGLKDTLLLANEEIEKKLELKDFYSDILVEMKEKEFNILSWKKILLDLWSRAIEIEKKNGGSNIYWNTKIKHMISRSLREMQRIFPWTDMVLERPDHGLEAVERLIKLPTNQKFISLNEELDSIIFALSQNHPSDEEDKNWIEELMELLQNSKKELKSIYLKLDRLMARLQDMATATDFSALYDKKRQLFSIGYDIERESLGNCYYDLLASESRQASFIAIAKGDIEQKHWFKLGRAMTLMDKSKGLVSWSGTMFEYFMPLLIMKSYPDTLLNETYEAVIGGQKKYGRDRRVPWGISESAYHSFDVSLNYQYKAFGVPGIGLKRGLVNELVIAPYATVMALQIDGEGAYNNIVRLIQEGLEGRYGFYEAVDYTKERLPKGKKRAIVKCFMVHHEGMSLMALDNYLNANILQERFHRVPKVKATELLLQERVPKRVVYDREQQFDAIDMSAEKQSMVIRNYNTANTEMPETHLLSNGSYSLMISNSGGGYSKKNDMMVYRWREDVTLDNSGMFFYIKNTNSNEYWSAAYEPCKTEGEEYAVIFSLDKAEFKRKDGNLSTHTEVIVCNEDNAEIRRISITNHSEHSRVVEITSYCEVTLSSYNADIAHPTFSNLFVNTEFLDNPICIVATRRPRAKEQKQPWMMQTVALEGEAVGVIQYETSRANFIGRGRSVSNPIVMENDAPLQNIIGAVLDPIISIRRRIKINPGETCKISYTTAVGESREEVIELAKKYKELVNINRAFELAWTQTAVEMKYLGIKSLQANLYQLMASKIIFLNPLLRQREEYIKGIKKGQRALWRYGISGDLPIVLLLVRKERDVDYVRQLLNAHEYWSIKGFKVDLVILNLQEVSYIQSLQDSIRDLIGSSYARDKQNKPGGVFLNNSATMEQEDMDLLMGIARLVIDSEKGLIVSQIREEEAEVETIEELKAVKQVYDISSNPQRQRNLEFFNGFGGFDTVEDKYVMMLKDKKNTPAPWINVIANKDFGFHVSESGSAYTWYRNSREYKLTSWNNDPITDIPSEALYIRDEIDGSTWSICPKPIRDEGEYVIEYGYGVSTFKHEAHGILGQMTMFVPKEESVKLYEIKLKNNSNIKRTLSLTYYAQMVLGVVAQNTAQYISSYINEKGGFIYAQNPYSDHFGKIYSYLKIAGGSKERFTGDRSEFIGRGRDIEKPEALRKIALSNRVGAGLDPCLAAQTIISIEPQEEKTLIVILGAHEDMEIIESTVAKYERFGNVSTALKEIQEYWNTLLHSIKVKTPDKSMDIMLNGWLMYQTIACRVWARSAFYQSGGAYGFRDQLQDVMSAGYFEPKLTRDQICYAASKQFEEGDVQHWWHPYVGSGIRTRFSDDLLWLPFVTIDYIKNTGDYGILEESIGFLKDAILPEDEDERYAETKESEESASLYEHCVRTIDLSLRFGAHNIPLMGSGDWNDGMSTVGNKGRGESVWLGWFLYTILNDFKEICKRKNDSIRYTRYEEMQNFIQENLEKNAWDGGWYRRAYFDDGRPLGSIENDECQIDSLSQSWAVISKAAKVSRAQEAMEALERYLVKEDKGMVLLLTPAFDKSSLEPGYIKGYVPGVRENGGQYTHAATWVSMAFAALGEGDKAWKIFNMINPINHTRSFYECEKYKVEPYVMTADVYAKEPHVGRGGWSWYTGAAGWMYRVGIDSILGLKLKEGKGFTVQPCIPKEWEGYSIEYTRGDSKYFIQVKRGEEKGIILDGEVIEGEIIPFMEKGEHHVEIIIEKTNLLQNSKDKVLSASGTK